MVEGSFNGVKGSFKYQMEIEVDEQNVKKWKTWRLFITDTSTGNRITVVDIGNEKDPNSYNKKADDKARFVEMSLCQKGFQVSRS